MFNISNVSIISNLSSNYKNISEFPKNPYTEFQIIIMMCFSALILIYMMTFIEKERDDCGKEKNENCNNCNKKIKINPYLPFCVASPLISPIYYNFERNKVYSFSLTETV